MVMADTVEQIKEKLDVAEFIRQYVNLSPAGKNLKGLCPFHKEKTPSFIVSPDRQIWHCFGCFPPGQKVKTPFGYHNIETIDEQHYVYSGKGEIRKVLATHKRNYQGELVDVLVRMLGGTVSLTTDHKLKIIRPKTKYFKKTKQFYRLCRELVKNDSSSFSKAIERHGDLLEIHAGDLCKNDFVLYPVTTRISEVKKINLKDYLKKSYTFGPRPPELRYAQDVDESFLKLVGYWIAEGSNHRAYTRFSLGNHEEDFAQEIVSLVKELFDLEGKIHRRPANTKRTGLEITACHAYLANIFGNLCGKGAENKHIPFILQELSPDKQKIIVDAIFKGDGHSYIASRSTKRHKAIATVSRVLAEQIVDVLLRNNIFPHLHSSKERTDKLGVHHKEAYTVVWSEEAKAQHTFVYKDTDGSTYWLLPVKKVERRAYIGPVYNLTVEKDHSYIATNFAVANCGVGGDVIGFLMRYENLEFIEALRVLAEKAGIDLRVTGGTDQRQYAVLYEVNQTAKDFFRDYLNSDAAVAKSARDYLKERGLKDETIREFEIGLAPNSSDVLNRHLIKIGYKIGDIERTGLVYKTERGTYWDRFRHRIMFPLHNNFGKPIGFTGRIMPGSEDAAVGKYVNSPETPIFNKSKLLFGFDKSKNAVRDSKTAVVVEGQMDLIMAYQDGVKNVIATSGTALTPEHLKTLKRLADTLILAFDNDEAGQVATERVIDLAYANDFSIKVVNTGVSDLKDPADLAKETPGALTKFIGEAELAMNFYFRRYLGAIKKGPAGISDIVALKQNIRNVLTKVKNISSSVEQAFWIRELSGKVNIPEQSLLDEIKVMPGSREPKFSVPGKLAETPEMRNFSRRDLLAQRFIGLALTDSSFGERLGDYINFLAEPYQLLVKCISSGTLRSVPTNLNSLADLISLRAGLEIQEPESMRKEFEELARHIRLEYLKDQREFLSSKIKEAEKRGSEMDMNEALREFDRLSKEIYNI